MEFKEYVDTFGIDLKDFAYISGLAQSTCYNYYKGAKATRSNAKIIEKATKGKVTYNEIVKKKRDQE